jgi:hypothetical protein
MFKYISSYLISFNKKKLYIVPFYYNNKLKAFGNKTKKLKHFISLDVITVN